MTGDTGDSGIAFLATLESIIRQRMEEPDTQGSYVATLAARGERRMAQKLGEEAVEMVLAASGGTRAEQVEEAADLLFHLLVLLQAKDIPLAEVATELEQRHRRRIARQR